GAVATWDLPELHSMPLIIAAGAIGAAVAWTWGRKVATTDMPQMVALCNGLGGGSAAALGAGELLRWSSAGVAAGPVPLVLALLGALIGSVALAGSIIAWAKLGGRRDKRYVVPGMQAFNALVALGTVALPVL